ncbi:hypothetical protein BCR33DRAFT_810641 [Rhizoclosmatium globosum]|uniref:Uncharacterized protein n=1 Tax=Rhizoclosmatium globosum TaxID=329046 RepID=A0A1Y2AND5_9FUNG|nr:hypothetical protein BCR33DRAFT_810641 [Rhizoclosmatium globosum]|eukprot:ORY23465.1 hypothetical protein BCR33DRAFT_810641 [Rhizoclosmatium globosum]
MQTQTTPRGFRTPAVAIEALERGRAGAEELKGRGSERGEGDRPVQQKTRSNNNRQTLNKTIRSSNGGEGEQSKHGEGRERPTGAGQAGRAGQEGPAGRAAMEQGGRQGVPDPLVKTGHYRTDSRLCRPHHHRTPGLRQPRSNCKAIESRECRHGACDGETGTIMELLVISLTVVVTGELGLKHGPRHCLQYAQSPPTWCAGTA